jgi:hypothetical protein
MMITMSKIIDYMTGAQANVLALLGSKGEGLTAEQRRRLDLSREHARRYEDERIIRRRLTTPDALEHLIAGHTDSDAPDAGNAYHEALHCLIRPNASDPMTLATYSSPETFFELVDEQMRALGVPSDLLPHGFLYGGLPPEFPHLPPAIDGIPTIGYLPVVKAKPVADAYRAVVDRLTDGGMRYEVELLIKALETEHEEYAFRPDPDGYTIFFVIGG